MDMDRHARTRAVPETGSARASGNGLSAALRIALALGAAIAAAACVPGMGKLRPPEDKYECVVTPNDTVECNQVAPD